MIGPLSYIGGKNRLASRILALLPDHQTYVEPFSGGAQVFFHKPPSKVEVLNDLDFDIVNFLRVCQWHHTELVRHLRYLVVSRRWYGLLAASDPETLTDIQRAARFFYLQKNSFGGKVTGRNYHYAAVSHTNYNPARIPHILERAHQRLERVQIESLPYDQVLSKYDRPTTVFYLDPPYYGRTLYNFNFTPEDFVRLANHLERLQGKFLLSLNDCPEVRTIFRPFLIEPIDLAYSAQQKRGERYHELLISNYPLPVSP